MITGLDFLTLPKKMTGCGRTELGWVRGMDTKTGEETNRTITVITRIVWLYEENPIQTIPGSGMINHAHVKENTFVKIHSMLIVYKDVNVNLCCCHIES